MSRRTVAPIMLLVAAALSIAAVFVVHDIESAGGPLSQPSAVPPHFSPNGDGVQDTVEISFTTKRAERVTLDILDADDRRVARLLDDERVVGEETVRWDGDGARDGRYRAVLTRAGDDREYEPVNPIVLDTRPPRGRIDRARLEHDRVLGLALLEADTTIVFLDANREPIEDSRVFAPPNPDAASAQPTGRVPRGLDVLLFYVDERPFDLYAEDLAGNRLGLHMALDAPGEGR